MDYWRALLSNKKHHSLAPDIHKIIRELKQEKCKMRYNWVKVHITIPGSKLADEMEKHAVEGGTETVYYKSL